MQGVDLGVFVITNHGEVDCPRDVILSAFAFAARVDDKVVILESEHAHLPLSVGVQRVFSRPFG
jgi:hypothetical protein